MRKRHLLHILLPLSLALACRASAHQPGGPDSLIAADSSSRSYTLDEIVVTATRTDARRAAAPSPVSLVSRSEIENEAGSSVADVLKDLPGTYVRSYGGPGALNSISLRGLGAEHTLVLVDGQRYTNFQNGQTDAGILSSSHIDHVEVARGGYSSLYGADALGGVVNIVTKKPERAFRGQLFSSAGSNGYSAFDFGVNGSADSVGLSGFIRTESGNGQYAFDFSDGKNTTRLRRSGADYRLLFSGGRIDFAPAEEVHTTLSLSYDRARRGTPGAVTDAQSAGAARLDDEAARIQTSADWQPSRSVLLSVKSSFFSSNETYRDPLLLVNNAPLNSFYANRAWFLTPACDLLFSPELQATGGCELVRATITSNDVLNVVRWQRSAFASAQYAVQWTQSIPFELLFYPSLRFDDFSDVGSALSPKLGMNAGILHKPELRLRASAGRSFRAPTFNDLYWRDGGNPNLKPERSFSADCGAIASPGAFTFEASYFSISTKDRIVWIPSAGTIWSPKNIAQVNSHGLETEATYKALDGALAFTLNSTWLTARKESEDYPGDPTRGKILIYVPRQTVNATVTITTSPLTFFVQHQWVSYRYTTEVNDRFLPHYSVTSASVLLRYPLGGFKTSLKLEVSNLFNSSYQVIALYPMPLREMRATAGVSL